jgi:organic radical activating enzyme
MGIMITSKCNFKCRHCMFSCNAWGKHMSDDNIKIIGNFIRRNNPYEINIYGGEPFVDTEHFDKCFDEFYSKDVNFHISSNGSFLADEKKIQYVWDTCRKMQNNTSSLGGAIRISNTIFHDECRTDKMKKRLGSLKWVLEEFYSWHEIFGNPDDEYETNPITRDGGYDKSPVIYMDNIKPSGYEGVNPSGRGVDISYSNRKCSCVLFADNKYYSSEHEMFVDCASININYKGEVGMCCYCDCGTIGHISEFENFEQIEEEIMKFRKQFREKYDFGNNILMDKACPKCKKFKHKKGE